MAIHLATFPPSRILGLHLGPLADTLTLKYVVFPFSRIHTTTASKLAFDLSMMVVILEFSLIL
jgi:hypothetical protein